MSSAAIHSTWVMWSRFLSLSHPRRIANLLGPLTLQSNTGLNQTIAHGAKTKFWNVCSGSDTSNLDLLAPTSPRSSFETTLILMGPGNEKSIPHLFGEQSGTNPHRTGSRATCVIVEPTTAVL